MRLLLLLVLPALLIATGALLAAAQVPKLILGKSQQRSSPRGRRRAWLSFHAGVLYMTNGVQQMFRWSRWDRDPLLLAQACYLAAVVMWLVTPHIRRSRRSDEAAPGVGPGEPLAAGSGEVSREADARVDIPARLDELCAEGVRLKERSARLEERRARLAAELAELQDDFEQHEHAVSALKLAIGVDRERGTGPQVSLLLAAQHGDLMAAGGLRGAEFDAVGDRGSLMAAVEDD